MTDRTAPQRVARMRERQAKGGLKRVEVLVPADREEAIREEAKRLREEAGRDHSESG